MVTALNDHRAPGRLEPARELLNSWFIDNADRTPRDELATLAAPDEFQEMSRFRDELRDVLEHPERLPEVVDRWVHRFDIRPTCTADGIGYTATDSTVAGTACAVLESIRDRNFHRLKACPECRWVFYDNSRNASKRWCAMIATEAGGRSCGNIAKARRFRERASGRYAVPRNDA
jgi:hypothetical protein